MQPSEIYIVLDRSGSMASVAPTVVAELNRFVATLAVDRPGARVTLVAFDSADPFEVIWDGQPAGSVPPITLDRYRPGGGTPLHDALGAVIRLATRRAAGVRPTLPRPEVLVAVVTDGEENDSVRYGPMDIYGKILRRKAAGWEFLFLGAGRDPIRQGAALGFGAGEIVPWVADDAGTGMAFATLTATALRPPRPRRH